MNNCKYDVASGLSQGKRPYQEDSLITDFHNGQDYGLVVLADGMGGHAAGDVASRSIVLDMFNRLKFQISKPDALEEAIAQQFRDGAEKANQTLADRVEANPDYAGMGATLVAAAFFEKRLYWISVGDSPLYILRNGKLSQINEDHSMAGQLQAMVKTGQLSQEEADTHPDRNALTSVLMGEEIARMDVPDSAFDLAEGDLIIVSSDGVQYLDNATIEAVANAHQPDGAQAVVNGLLTALEELGDPRQDNIAIAAVQICDARTPTRRIQADPSERTRVPDAGRKNAPWGRRLATILPLVLVLGVGGYFGAERLGLLESGCPEGQIATENGTCQTANGQNGLITADGADETSNLKDDGDDTVAGTTQDVTPRGDDTDATDDTGSDDAATDDTAGDDADATDADTNDTDANDGPTDGADDADDAPATDQTDDQTGTDSDDQPTDGEGNALPQIQDTSTGTGDQDQIARDIDADVRANQNATQGAKRIIAPASDADATDDTADQGSWLSRLFSSQ